MEEIRTVKKFDKSLLIACLIGGAVGFLLAELLYSGVTTEWAPVLRTGLFFAVAALGVCLAAMICECATGNLKGASWTGMNIGVGFLVILGSAIAFFLLGMLFQFLYGLGVKAKTAEHMQDYIILIDNSGSTDDTDPNEERFSSVAELVRGLDSTHNVMVKVFDEDVLGSFPVTPAGEEAAVSLEQFFEEFDSNGGTDLQKVLMEALDEYTPNGRETAVLLLSDGFSEIELDVLSDAFNEKEIPIFCVSFSDTSFEGSQLLSQIAAETNGYYYEIEELSGLTNAVETMIRLAGQRLLLDARTGADSNAVAARILRILFVTILGCLLGVAVALAVNNSTVMTAGMPVHAAGSLLAGLVIEFGWILLPGFVLRLLMTLLMSVIAVSYMKSIPVFPDDEREQGRKKESRRKPGKAKDLHRDQKEPEDPKSLV